MVVMNGINLVDLSIIFLTFTAIVTYKYACQPANITSDKWEIWAKTEVWKLVLSEIITVLSYVYIFIYCYGYWISDYIVGYFVRISKNTTPLKHSRHSMCLRRCVALFNLFTFLAYAFSPSEMDTVPNNHLFYNRMGLRYGMPTLLVFFCFVYSFVRIYRHRPKLFLAIVLVAFTLMHMISNRTPIVTVRYNHSESYCIAPIRYDLMKVHQIVASVVHSVPFLYTCKYSFETAWMNNLPNKPLLLAYPNITEWGLNKSLSKSIRILGENVRRNLINLDGNLSKISEHELVISRLETNKIPKVYVNTVRRSDIPLVSVKSSQENLLVIFIDGVSRPFAEIYLPQTLKLLQMWKDKLNLNYHTYLRYQHFPDRSRGNRTPFFVGYSFKYLLKQKSFSKPSFQKTFSNAGYVTGYVSSSCEMGFWGPMATNNTWLYSVPREFFVDVYHHHMLFCDENFIDLRQPIRPDKGPWSTGMHCMYGKQLSELSGMYASSFFHTYYDKQKFMYMDLIEMHDALGTNLESIDTVVRNTLQEFEKFTHNTTIVIYGDHPHFISLDRMYHLPYLSIIRPAHHKIPAEAELNQQKLYTVYDLRSTLLDIFSINSNVQEHEGRNLYSDLSPSRSCAEAHVDIESCSCK